MEIIEQKKLISPGEIYKLGDHLLACGDCKDTGLVDKLVTGEGNIRLILTDPPYNVNYSEKNIFLNSIDKGNRNKTPIINDHIINYQELIEKTFFNIKNKLSEKNSIYIFDGGREIHNLISVLTTLGFYYSQMIIWIKNNIVIGRKDYNPQHEIILYGWYGVHKFERCKDKSVIFHAKPHRSKLHPTMKPIGLLRKFILNSSKTNDIVYDPFGGSGSTLMACEQTKRKCLMIEIDPYYCQVIIDRWEKYTGKLAEKYE